MKVPRAILFDCGSTLLHLGVDELARDLELTDASLRSAFQASLLVEHAVAIPEAWCLLATGGLEALPYFRRALQSKDLYSCIDPDAIKVVSGLRARGLRVGVVANGEGQLRAELDRIGVLSDTDVAVDSHIFGAPKPNGAIFQAALEELDVSADEAWFVGDSLLNDILGALRAGFQRAILYDRDDLWCSIPAVRISRLSELLDLLDQC